MGLQTLDVVIGLVFMYVLLSLACTTLNELVAQWMNSRADTLEEGLHKLFTGRSLTRAWTWRRQAVPQAPTDAKEEERDAENAKLLLDKFWEHPIIRALRQKRRRPFALLGTEDAASYIPVTAFSTAFFHVVAPTATTCRELVALLDGLPPQIAEPLRAFANEGGELADVQRRVQRWYQDVMERVSGLYKRKTQLRILVLSALLTVLAHADTLRIARALAESAALRAVVVAQAESLASMSPAALGIDTSTVARADTAGSAGGGVTGRPNAAGRPEEPPLPAPVTGAAAKKPERPTTPAATEPAAGISPDGAISLAATRRLQMIRRTLDSLNMLGVPLGWPPLPRAVRARIDADTSWKPRALLVATYRAGDVLLSLPGLALTTLAVSLGAPFWFDMLNKVINIRAAGRAPEEHPKSPAGAPPARGTTA
ncbi:hypothetical protein [Roseisolibacter agri]|uniref:Uncharacterized protein n=1 Tax=Roseisolibacter agri TaxID=2014610 RepID=A0AA37V2H3_9BACT|nr:hypothetical protein [Roseisolibacter agri]GLC27805.1 hypothetical protein rosag_43180 [Roseisolibacter agri]